MDTNLIHHVNLVHGFTPGPIQIDDAVNAQLQLHRDRVSNLAWHNVMCDTKNWAPDAVVFGVRGQYLPTINQIHMFEYQTDNPLFRPVLTSLNSIGSIYHELRHAYNASCFFFADGPWDYRTFALDEVTARVAEFLADASKMPKITQSVADIDVNYTIGHQARYMIANGVRNALNELESSTHYQSYWKRYETIQNERLTSTELRLPDETIWMQMRLFFINDTLVDIYQYLPAALLRRTELFLSTPPLGSVFHSTQHDRER